MARGHACFSASTVAATEVDHFGSSSQHAYLAHACGGEVPHHEAHSASLSTPMRPELRPARRPERESSST